MLPDKKKIKLIYEKVHNQNNVYDFGIFAIAFATSIIIYNRCPCSVTYKKELMRKHLSTMYRDNFFQLFPTTNVIPEIVIDDINALVHSKMVISKNFIDEYVNIDINYLETLRDKFRSREATKIYEKHTINGDGSITKVVTKHTKRNDPEAERKVKKSKRKQEKNDGILQRVVDAEKKN